MSRRISSLLFVAAAASLAACASGGQPTPAATPVTETSTPPAAAARRPRVDQQLLTRETLLATERTNVYDAIQLLRSHWLRQRPADSFAKPSQVQVYFDNQRVNGLDDLRSLSVRDVASARFVDAVAATSRWGADHASGAIVVQMAR
jgi:hypothetical protein